MNRAGIWFRILTNPLTILTGVIGGAIVGFYYQPAVVYLVPIGMNYVALLILCILPIIFTSIIYSLAQLLKDPQVYQKIGHLFAIFIIGIVLVGVFGTLVGLVAKPSLKLSSQAEYKLGKLIKVTEVYPPQVLKKGQLVQNSSHLNKFLTKIVPGNIVADLSEGITLKVMIIALLLGLALGKITGKSSHSLLNLVEAVGDMFNLIFRWLLYFLPFGMCCIFAKQAANLNFEMLVVLFKFILLFYGAGIVLLIVYNIIISMATGDSIFKVIGKLKQPLLLAFFAESVFIPVPSALHVMRQYKFNQQIVDLVLPFGVIINQQGRVLLIALLTVFVAHFYAVHLGWAAILILILTASFLGTIIPGRVLMMAPMFATIASAIGVPAPLGALILVIIDPFVARLESVLTVNANCALVALAARSRSHEK